MKFIENSNFKDIPAGRMNNEVIEMLEIMKDTHERTASHVVTVALVATEIGIAMGYSLEKLIVLKEAALLHDIGKVVPDIMEIVKLPRKLTDEEFVRIKDHAAEGANILEHLGAPLDYIQVAAFHHERPDGFGYNKINANELPEIVRVVTVADAFTAMWERRVYAEVKEDDVIIQEMIDLSGKQFDAEIVATFVEHIYKAEQGVPLEKTAQ